MATTKITSDQLTFKSSATGDHLLDTYIESAEIGGQTLAQLLSQIFDPGTGDFDSSLIDIQLRTKPLFPTTLQYSVDGGTTWTDFATIPTGAGTGDMLAANNLSDLVSAASARTNLGLGTLATLNAVGTGTITDATVTLAKLSPTTPLRLFGSDGGGAAAEITPSGGLSLVGNVLSSVTSITDHNFSNPADFVPALTPVGFSLTTDPVAKKNVLAWFDGVLQHPSTFTIGSGPDIITFTNGIPSLVQSVRVLITK